MKFANPEYLRMVHAEENYTTEDNHTFLKGLENPDPYIVWHAIKGVGLKKIREAVPTLVQILGTPPEPLGEDENTDLCRIAAWALAEIGYDDMAQYVQGIEKNPNPLLREGFADALGMTKDPRALEALGKLMSDPVPSVRLWAALSLSKLGEVALPVIDHKLGNTSDLRTAFYLLDALRKIGTPSAREITNRYLEKSEWKELKDAFAE